MHASTTKIPLQGIIHAGGVLKDGSILSCNMNGLRAVYAPKANGLMNIEKVQKIAKYKVRLDHLLLIILRALLLSFSFSLSLVCRT